MKDLKQAQHFDVSTSNEEHMTNPSPTYYVVPVYPTETPALLQVLIEKEISRVENNFATQTALTTEAARADIQTEVQKALAKLQNAAAWVRMKDGKADFVNKE